MSNMISKKQNGFVSIITVITISVLLSLLTLSFVQIINRSQRQTLDSQLSTQANYAAETGINDAIRAILNNPGAIPQEDTNCDPTPAAPGIDANVNKSVGDNTNGGAEVEYTCQLISSGVKDVRIDLTDQSSRIYPVKTDGSDANTITIEWEDSTTKTNFTAPGSVAEYPSLGSWGSNTVPMLRLTVFTPCPNGCPDFNSATMIANQKNLFIKPSASGSGTVDLSASADGVAAYGECQPISANRPYAAKLILPTLVLGQHKIMRCS
jgi:Tfp pilus assembly protein PilX